MQTSSASDPRQRWGVRGAGHRYDEERWSHRRRRARDPAMVRRILARDGVLSTPGSVLDIPCGTGRLRSVLSSHASYVGADISPEMLAAAARASSGPSPQRLLRADSDRLPFRDDTFDVVVCCRLLHHLRDVAAIERTLGELVRVSSGWVVASIWDAGSLEALRQRLPFTRSPRHRIARPRTTYERAAGAVGATIVAWRTPLPLLSQQAWFVARKDGSPGEAK